MPENFTRNTASGGRDGGNWLGWRQSICQFVLVPFIEAAEPQMGLHQVWLQARRNSGQTSEGDRGTGRTMFQMDSLQPWEIESTPPELG
jgi:hypothetical protein